MKKCLLSVFISMMLISTGCDLSFLQKAGEPQESSSQQGQTTDNPQQEQGGKIAESQDTIDFFYTVEGRNVTLTPVVSKEAVDEDKLVYFWLHADGRSSDKNPTITVGERATSTLVTLYVFNGEQKEENVLGTTSKTISLTGTFPTDAATGTGPKKLFLFADDANHPDKNLDYMYFALRIEGESKAGSFRTEATKNGQSTYAYPRSVQYEHKSSDQDRYTSMYAQATPNLASLGVGYSDTTGFSTDAEGKEFSMPFYLGDNKCRVQTQGTSTLRYSFANFVVWDTTVDTFLGNMGWPVLIRLASSEPLVVEIPMDSYDPSKYKNIALLTVTFNDNASKTNFEYKVEFDGFEPK